MEINVSSDERTATLNALEKDDSDKQAFQPCYQSVMTSLRIDSFQRFELVLQNSELQKCSPIAHACRFEATDVYRGFCAQNRDLHTRLTQAGLVSS